MRALLLIIILSIPKWTVAKAPDPMRLVGKAMLEFSIFKIDIYEISYYKNSKGQEKLELVYQRDIKKEHSILGWEKGMEPLLEKRPELKEKFQWLLDHTIELKEKDKFTILRDKNFEVILLKNEKVIAKIIDKDIYKMSFYPWLGEIPVDEDLKKKLLGNSY